MNNIHLFDDDIVTEINNNAMEYMCSVDKIVEEVNADTHILFVEAIIDSIKWMKNLVGKQLKRIG